MNFRFLLKEWLNPLKVYLFEWKHTVSNSLSLTKTIYVNFKLLPYCQARELPIFIYRHTKIYELGKMEIDSPEIFTGMIRWGRMNVKSSSFFGKIRNEGKITFKGDAKIGGSTILENRGQIILGEDVWMGEKVTLMIRSNLEIGKKTMISPGCIIYDSNDHFTINIENKIVKRADDSISIGEYNWIGACTFVKKGTVTGNHTISAAGYTLLCKDYRSLPPHTILGGNPAKPIGSGIRTILNQKEENIIKEIFNLNPEKNEIKIDIEDGDLDLFCGGEKLRL